MKILYISAACSPQKFSEFDGLRVSDAAQKYNQLLAQGFAANGIEVQMICTRPITRLQRKKLFYPAEKDSHEGVTYHYLPVLNLGFLRNLIWFFGVFFRVLFSRGFGRETVVVCDALKLTAAPGALLAAFFKRYRTLAIVTDAPMQEERRGFNDKIMELELPHYQSYLFLTEAANTLLNKKGKPYIVVEGHIDASVFSDHGSSKKENHVRICMYAGSLMRMYGIAYLVEGFTKANIPNTRLDIYGVGEYQEELKQISKTHSNVRYFGRRSNAEVIAAEQEATLLINPRPSNKDYTKYSFPSKNLEYMASGTPVLTTCLPGMPEDHKLYVFLLNEENADGLAEALNEIFSLGEEQLRQFGENAKQYVLKEKNNIVQAKKIIDFLNDSFFDGGKA